MLHTSAGTSSITTRRSSCQKAERTKAERTFVLSQAGQEADSWSLTSMVAPFMWFRGSAEGRSLPSDFDRARRLSPPSSWRLPRCDWHLYASSSTSREMRVAADPGIGYDYWARRP